MKKIITFLFPLFCMAILLTGCSSNNLVCSFSNVGVWWWDDSLSLEYLTFADSNSVTDIYYCSSEFGNNTKLFIEEANKKNISVYYLAGEYEWLENNNKLINKITAYINYQQSNPKAMFSGIHLDIEPHQHPEFNTKRKELITALISLAHTLKTNYPTIIFDYDIPFWLNDEITFNNITLPAYAHMINVANQVHVMSYRDTAEQIYKVSKEEIEYATSQNKKIFLSVETKSSEGNSVSFMEEGKMEMYNQINQLYSLSPNVGINIHHIKSWHSLKNK